MDAITTALLEEDIQKAFAQANEYGSRAAVILSLLSLEPIEDKLSKNYKTWIGDRRLKFPPMAVIKSLLLKDLKGISSHQQLITYLCTNPEESTLLGFDKFLPSLQTFSIMKNERIDDEIQEQMNFVVDRIRQFAKDNDRELDIDFLPVGNRKGESRRTVQRHVSREGGKVARYMKKVILPMLTLPPDERKKYKNGDLINALGYMAERQICANQGCNLMREDERFKGKAPHGHTLLGRLAKMDSKDARSTSIQFFDTVFRLAKSRGLVPSHPVALALDFTDIPYYGDSNVQIVVEGKPDKGTYHKHRHVIIKISERWGDLFLLSLPIGAFTNDREAVRTLIKFAKERVSISHIIVDRGFFSCKFLSLFEEMGVRYLMPGVKNARVKRLITEGQDEAEVDMSNRKFKAHVKFIFKKGQDRKTACFATNLPSSTTFDSDLFLLYSRRWNVETGFRVIKHEFMAKTTTTQYKIRLLFFTFSMLLYNIWVIVNAALNRILFGTQEGERLMSAKLFMIKFYDACVDYGPPPDGL